MLHFKTVNRILHEEISNYLEIVQGEGYIYFIYDNGEVYETHSVMTPRLNNLSIDSWFYEAKEFLKRI